MAGVQFVQFATPPQASRNMDPERPLRVLVVDDYAAVRRILRRYLESRGCEVTTAARAVEGLDAIRRGSFDLVVTDVDMPGGSGLDLWREATSVRPELRGRFLFCSGAAAPARLAATGERFLPKPFGPAELWAAMHGVLGDSHAGCRETEGGGGAGPRE